MIWLPVIGLILGFSVYWLPIHVPSYFSPYLAEATLAGLDSICGGIKAGLDSKFHDAIFISGFLVNTCLAAVLAFLGDQIGVDLLLAAVVALGGRIFLNLSLIRRYWISGTRKGTDGYVK